MTTHTSTVAALSHDLQRRLPPGRLLTAAGRDRARRIWNGAVKHAPALIVRPQSTDDVQAVISTARQYGFPLSVRGGGHDWAGRSLRHNGLVIDLSAMNRVVVDPLTQTAVLQGGATATDVIAAAQPHTLSATTGTVGAVGMAGLTLGGGYGPLIGRYGLALDNLLGAEVVFADGLRVNATRSQEPELYWALRGGGGNFGAVTSLTMRLHPVPDLLAGFIAYPWSDAAHIWARLADIVVSAPDELTVQTAILSSPDGDPTLVLTPVWCGEPATGRIALASLTTLGTPLSAQIQRTTCAALLSQFDTYVVTGRHYAMRTRTVAAYSPEVITVLLEAGQRRTSNLSAVSVHHFHGAPTRVPLQATAFGVRERHLMIEILAAWEPEDDPSRHLAWAHLVAAGLAPHALPGGYPNLLGPTDHDQIAHAYGPNASRLRAAKSRYDPDGVFSAIPLPLG